jgi:hypothetical protein
MTTAAELEHLGREGQIDRARVLLARLEVEVEAFLDALHRFEQGTS